MAPQLREGVAARQQEGVALWLSRADLLGLAASTALVATGLAFRVRLTQRGTYLFLLWNLALAWAPALLAPAVEWAWRQPRGRWASVPLGVLWLAMFPNAPYVVTDLVHLRPAPGVPVWFDASLLFAAAWTGLLLGFDSLERMQRLVAEEGGASLGFAFALGTLGLAAVGVQLGRFQRWNSWDLLSDPVAIAADLVRAGAEVQARHFELFFAALLMCGYWVWHGSRRRRLLA